MNVSRFLMSIIICFSILSPAFAESDGYFGDSINHKYREVIKSLSDLNIVEGYKDAEGNLTGEYGPDNIILRAELLKIVLEAGKFGPFPAKDCFTDVKASEWYSGYACKALELGFVEGYADGSFKPEREVSFVEALKIMMTTTPPSAVNWETLEIDPERDVLAEGYWSGHDWYEKGVRLASEMEIIPTDVDGFDISFKRGQMAEMYMRLVRSEWGELENHPGYNPDVKVTFESLSDGLNVEREYWLNAGVSFDKIAPITDSDRSVIRNFVIFGGGIAEVETQEGYRVTLNLPDGAVKVDQTITVSPLKAVPFEHVISDFKGSGVYIKAEYGLTGHHRGWLVFDFSPEGRTWNRQKSWDYCRSDITAFNVMQCLNANSMGLERDNLFFITFTWDRGMRDPSLVPHYKISDDVYAVEVLEEGVYLPVYLSQPEVLSLEDQSIDDLSTWDIDRILALADAFDYYSLTPDERLEELLIRLVDQRISYADYYLYGSKILKNLGYHNVAANLMTDFSSIFEKELGYSRQETVEYIATIAVASNNGYVDLPSLETDTRLLTALTEGIIHSDLDRKINSYEALNEVLKGIDRISINDRFWLTGWLIPTAYADIWTIDEIWEDARNNIRDLINQTNDFDSLLMLASIALSWESDDLADEAFDKAKNHLADAIAKAPAPGSDDGEICEALIKKNLANYAQNSCDSAMDSLLDLARNAMRIEEDDLADEALSKAGLID